jgi:hypothetical protein
MTWQAGLEASRDVTLEWLQQPGTTPPFPAAPSPAPPSSAERRKSRLSFRKALPGTPHVADVGTTSSSAVSGEGSDRSSRRKSITETVSGAASTVQGAASKGVHAATNVVSEVAHVGKDVLGEAYDDVRHTLTRTRTLTLT